ncbi:MAG: hypothetical protein RhofKO_03240 [Rhodothermales bacterium]
MSQPTAPDSAGADSNVHDEALERFILFWGEMASNWGINRTMAQIHALLYVSEDPLDTDTIMARLQISRGNANMNLRSLLNWNLVRKVHQPGSRKDFFYAEKDVWQMAAQIIRERERREIRPVMAQLQECREILLSEHQGADGTLSDPDQQFIERIDNLMDLTKLLEAFATAVLPFVEDKRVGQMRKLVELIASWKIKS